MPDLDAPVEVSTIQDAVDPVATESTEQAPPSLDEFGLAKFLGIQNYQELTPQDRDQIAYIWEHAAKDSKTQGETIRLIGRLERSLNSPNPGETRLGKIYSYLRLMEESNSIKDELDAYRNFG